MKRGELHEWLRDMSAHYMRKSPPDKIYWKMLKDYPVEDLYRATEKHMHDEKIGGYFPIAPYVLRHMKKETQIAVCVVGILDKLCGKEIFAYVPFEGFDETRGICHDHFEERMRRLTITT